MAKDINKQVFQESTNIKLSIFKDYFMQWLPVFLHHSAFSEIYVYDFFAGTGTDIENNPGSSLSLLDTIITYLKDPKTKISKKVNNIKLILNDNDKNKVKELENNVRTRLEAEDTDINRRLSCEIISCDFQDYIKKAEFNEVLADRRIAKFLLIDQYGFVEVTEKEFSIFTSAKNTDFIFFITSSFLKRFRNSKAVQSRFNVNFNGVKAEQSHRIVSQYFKSLIPKGKEYYIHQFSLQKENKSNYYGIIFGSNHTLGMEKFLKVCWDKDPQAGEASYNIDHNYEPSSLFADEEPIKIQRVKTIIKYLILKGTITNNICGMKFAMMSGCRPKMYVTAAKELSNENKISFVDKNGQVCKFKKASTKIHEIPIQYIKLNSNENDKNRMDR